MTEDLDNALLTAVVDAITAGPELAPLAARIAALVVDATPASACFVHVLDDGGAALTLAGASPSFGAIVGKVRMLLGEGVSGRVARTGEPVIKRTMASVPLSCSGAGVVGALTVHASSDQPFSERTVVLLTTIASLVAGAVQQARLHRRLAAREHAHERFAERVIAAQETERRRLAADIHDGISQRLISLSYHLDAAADALADAPDFTAEQLVLAREMIDLTLAEARAAIGGLRPPVLDDLGLASGLASLARGIAAVPVTVEADECSLPDHVEIALYRIAQEALQNVVKHSGARSASVLLRVGSDEVVLRIADDGAGFDPEAADSGFGLSGMAERAELVGGHLDVYSAPGRGSTIHARVPINPRQPGFTE